MPFSSSTLADVLREQGTSALTGLRSGDVRNGCACCTLGDELLVDIYDLLELASGDTRAANEHSSSHFAMSGSAMRGQAFQPNCGGAAAEMHGADHLVRGRPVNSRLCQRAVPGQILNQLHTGFTRSRLLDACNSMGC